MTSHDADRQVLREALRQQLCSDRLLGVRSVPLRFPVPARGPRAAQSTAAPAQRRQPSHPGAPAGGVAPAPATAPGSQADRLRLLNESQVRDCRKCKLCETRTQTVFGQGNADARLVFVGEAPGFEEDRQGLAFVGKAGQLLTRMIGAMGLTRDDVFICNVLKCRPPQNRDPSAEEILACSPYLLEQLTILRPEVLIALGSPAAKTLLGTAQSIGKLRGRFHDYFFSGTKGVGPSVPLMPTYHPAYLLRNAAEKSKTWSDLQMVMEWMGIKPQG